MKRDLINELVAWKNKNGRKPLILKGVRQTGKTYLLEEFGRTHFNHYYRINFEKQEKMRALFNKDLDPVHLINELNFAFQTTINVEEDLLIFDEIQACPNALTSLKYFCEDMPKLALCAAGSLLGLHLNEGSYPVGKVDMLHLFPMSFSEFLSGIGDDHSADYLAQLTLETDISSLAHDHLWKRLQQYFVTGGLPEVVSTFASQQEHLFAATQAVRTKQSELINAYYADIAKHAGDVNAMHIDRTWRAVPKQLATTQDGSANRFKFKEVLPEIHRYAQLVHVIDWLEAAELVIKLPIVETVQHPLSAFAKENFFKLMMFDIGILGAMANLSPEVIFNYDYGTYKGYFAENFVAQQMIASGHANLCSWQKDRSEVEFVLSHGADIIPIEVKSGHITKAQSLQKYIDKYHPPKNIILSGHHGKLSSDGGNYRLPLYVAERLVELVF